MIRSLLAAAAFAVALSPAAMADDTPKFSIKTSTIGQILDHSEASDLETWQDLLYLVQNGYLSVT